jgi:1-deoxy-D-xylulose-5-phosphate reductoisomerase
MAQAKAVAELRQRLPGLDCDFYHGPEGLQRLATLPEADLVVVAVSGIVGLQPLLAALDAGKDVATANKEPLVAAGQLIMEQVRRRKARFLPIDSEHSAIFQILQGQPAAAIQRLILTASGGPFRGRSRAELEKVTVEEALAHPVWNMGPKVTVDSATLMNKGLEVIEARWLFDVEASRIDIVIHPQSIVHSLVEFVDGSVLAQMDYPDMRAPIQFALTFPERLPSPRPRLNLGALDPLVFSPPDCEAFPALQLAYEAARIGGTLPAVLNAANEVAVQRFLERQIGFLDIARLVGEVMARHTVLPSPDLETILSADAWARTEAQRLSEAAA